MRITLKNTTGTVEHENVGILVVGPTVTSLYRANGDMYRVIENDTYDNLEVEL